MKNLILLLTAFNLLFFFQLLPAQEIQWACKVLGFSSQGGEKGHSADQILGHPNVYPDFGHSVSAWSPKSKYSETEWILVGFMKPQYVQQIVLVESFEPGCVEEIVMYDTDGKAHTLDADYASYSYSLGQRVMRIKMDETTFKVAALHISLNNSLRYGESDIDAVGLINQYSDALIRPNLLEKLSAYAGKEKMAYGINSSGDEIMPVVSPDGNELFFDRKDDFENMGEDVNDDIWRAELSDYGTFRSATNVGSPLNNKHHNFMIALCENGRLAILGNVYLPDGSMTSGISGCRREAGQWGTPFKIEIENIPKTGDYKEYNVSADLEVMVFALEREDGVGGQDLYASFRIDEKHYGSPIHMGNTINSVDTEMTPWISPNKKYLVFSSRGHSGFGKADLYFSRRLDNTWQNWSEPVNMGPAINSKDWDAYFTASPGNGNAYFCSVSGSDGGADIFKIELPELLQKEFGLK